MIVFKAHPKLVYAVAFSPDGRFLATFGGDKTLRLWSLDSMKEVKQWPGPEFAAPIAYSPDGRFIARGGQGVQVWAIEGSGEALVNSKQYTLAVSFSPDSKVFVAHGYSGDPLARWALPKGKPLPGGWGGTRTDDAFPTGGMAYHPDGSLLATVFAFRAARGFDSAIQLWDANAGELKGSLRSDHSFAHPSVIRFSPDGRLLAGIYGPLLRIWDVKTEKEVVTRKVGKKDLKGMVFTSEGRRLVTVSNDEMVHSWATSGWSEAECFEWKIGKLRAIDASLDGCRLAAGGSTGKVVIWDVDV